uniref:Uncharacterized protein n=1 Tax=Eptatretus burgeri TaxID=7764 RepID=A0A8C4QIY6_EPTBU
MADSRPHAEVQLAEYHPGRNLLNSNIGQGLRLPPNPSKVDRLIVDQLREQAKVASLFGKMEHLYTTHMCTNQLHQHLKAIHMLQASRKEEIDHASRHLKPTGMNVTTHRYKAKPVLTLICDKVCHMSENGKDRWFVTCRRIVQYAIEQTTNQSFWVLRSDGRKIRGGSSVHSSNL